MTTVLSLYCVSDTGLQVLIDYFEKRSPVSGGEVFAHERHGFAPERDFPIIHNFKI